MVSLVNLAMFDINCIAYFGRETVETYIRKVVLVMPRWRPKPPLVY